MDKLIEPYNLPVLEEAYKEYAMECEAALRLTMARILNLQEAFNKISDRSPFDSVNSRIKEFSSVIEKCKRRGYEIDIESIKENVRDVAGIRIITPFRDDIYTVAESIEHIPGINIVRKKDYVKEPKPNGYSSLHLHVQIEIYSPIQGGSKLIPIEIQIRDKSMDLWATIDHIINYRNNCPPPDAEEKFLKMSRILTDFANTAIELRDLDTEQ
ncbi:GTP pyrophosphokinase family protein [Candidatus Saccharibacteria bacterium]|nr:GTP pyrophosphokinase family protein [Candidatus Saccharibacteria bacterium]